MRFFCSLFFSVLFTSFTASALPNLPLYSQHYDETRNPFDDAKAAIKLANETNRNIIIEIGGTWCTWCSKMDAFLLENPQVAEALHKNFVLLKVSVNDVNDNAEFMKGLPPILGYPHMFVSTASGKMLLSKDTGEFLEDNQYSVKNWLSFINQWQPANNPAE